MYNFNFYNPVKVLFGPGRLNDLHNEALPGKKALIAIGGNSVKSTVIWADWRTSLIWPEWSMFFSKE